MKKILIISGILTAILLILFLTGWAGTDDTVKRSIKKGNAHYNNKFYLNALLSYEEGLTAKPEHRDLNFNAAQAAYSLGKYDKALKYYAQSNNRIVKFINTGNIYFKTGEQAEDAEIEKKLQCYTQAIQIYKEGILNYPHNVELKYNYELAMEKIEQIMEQKEQEKKSQSQDNQSEQNNQNQDESDEAANQDIDMDQQAIERILQMLEDQERESLKNNQEIIRGKEGAYGW